MGTPSVWSAATDRKHASVAAGSSIALPPSFTTTGRQRNRATRSTAAAKASAGSVGPAMWGQRGQAARNGKKPSYDRRQIASTGGKCGKTVHATEFGQTVAPGITDGYSTQNQSAYAAHRGQAFIRV